MDAKQIAKAAHGVAHHLGCAGTPEQDRIADAFEEFAGRIDPTDGLGDDTRRWLTLVEEITDIIDQHRALPNFDSISLAKNIAKHIESRD
jgi:hypothetical protein